MVFNQINKMEDEKFCYKSYNNSENDLWNKS